MFCFGNVFDLLALLVIFLVLRYVELRKCEKCSTVVTVISRETQTPLPELPRPKIMEIGESSFTGKGAVHVV